MKGFLAGLGAGLAGAVVLPVAGVVGGVTSVVGTCLIGLTSHTLEALYTPLKDTIADCHRIRTLPHRLARTHADSLFVLSVWVQAGW